VLETQRARDGHQQTAQARQITRRAGLAREANSNLASGANGGELEWTGYVYGRGDAQISGPLPAVPWC
jgi:hypothetical protein